MIFKTPCIVRFERRIDDLTDDGCMIRKCPAEHV